MNLKIKENEYAIAWYNVSFVISLITGIFLLISSALFVSNYIRLKSSDPLNSPEITQLKERLVNEPSNQELKEQIRKLDLKLRSDYFRHREFSRFGTYLLIGGMVIFLIAIKSYEYFKRKLPMPEHPVLEEDEELHNIKISRWSVIAIALMICISVFALITNSGKADFFRNAEQILAKAKEAKQVDIAQNLSSTTEGEISIPTTETISEATTTQQENAPIQTSTYPTDEELKKNWTRFRGYGGLGIVYSSNIPSSWDGKTGKNVLWKTKIELPGNNSPIVWGKKVFLTGATDKKREVYCFDADTGKILWQKSVENIPGSSPQPPKVSEDTGYAAPTATTDGQRVYAIFANGDLVAYDFDGNLVWAKNLGTPKSMYGYASSLLMFKNLLIVLYDQGNSEHQKR